MAFCTVHCFSNTLAKQVAMNVIVPDKGAGPFATFYLLHGMSDDYTIWHRRTRIEWYVRDMPLIVVMPDGFRGFYTNNNDGPAYATFFGEELIEFVERIFPATKTRAGRCIGGLSMGGYGALRLALGFPDLFVSAHSHSGALMAGAQLRQGPQAQEFQRIFGKDPTGSEHDLRVLAKRCAKQKKLPKLRIDCGADDFLIDANRRFHQFLTQQRIEHDYEEFPGEHNWDYWDLHVQEALRFHAKALKL
jgi:S-formylglutathione hydrolase FrmB